MTTMTEDGSGYGSRTQAGAHAAGRARRRRRWGWPVAMTVVPVLTVGGLFMLTDDTLVPFEDSALAQEFTQPGSALQDLPESVALPAAFGPEDSETSTLVVYDRRGEGGSERELNAIAAANLATHFGRAEIRQMADYEPGMMARYDGVVVIATSGDSTMPQSLVHDLRQEASEVLWVGQDVAALAASEQDPEHGSFARQYGWDPTDLREVKGVSAPTLTYRELPVDRPEEGKMDVWLPRITDPGAVEVLAQSSAGDPWVRRSRNLTVLSENPFSYIDTSDLYLVLADLYYDLLDSEVQPVRQAAVRLEDVGPEADPAQLRAVADYLAQEHVPFQVAVIPVQLDRTPDGDGWYGLSLTDRPEVVEALKYMQAQGGTLIQHGTTHQFGGFDNPYSGRSGEDYEFYQYGCSSTAEEPYAWESCRDESWIRPMRPVAENSPEQIRARLQRGRQVMADAGLGAPTIFETPHYGASATASRTMAELYDARYEQVEYYVGLHSGGPLKQDEHFSQIFPYTVQDIYGGTVYPETLQNITGRQQNNHDQRTAEHLLARAEDHLLVRESTASFFFHPYLGVDELRPMVEGLKERGFEFRTVTELQ